jgi:hypothetical protein
MVYSVNISSIEGIFPILYTAMRPREMSSFPHPRKKHKNTHESVVQAERAALRKNIFWSSPLERLCKRLVSGLLQSFSSGQPSPPVQKSQKCFYVCFSSPLVNFSKLRYL